MIYNQPPIICVDEWSFTRAVRQNIANYRFAKVHLSSMILWEGSSNLIMVAGSNVQWFGVIKRGTFDFKTFSIFLCLLEKVVMETNNTNSWKPVIILDNSKVHTSNYTKTVISSLKLDLFLHIVKRLLRLSMCLGPYKQNWEVGLLSGPSTLVRNQE